jgi:hypothetical protein
MPVVSPSAIVDAVAADLETLELGQRKTRKYVEPQIIDLQSELPLLAVWVGETHFTQLTTGVEPNPADFTRIHPVTVGWYVFDTAVNNRGFEDQDLYLGLETIKETLVARIGGYCQGVPGLTNVYGTLRSAGLRPIEPDGLWTAYVDLDVEQDA